MGRKTSPQKKTPTKMSRKADDAGQSRAFLEKAREIGADEECSTSDALMQRLARTLPEKKKGGDR